MSQFNNAAARAVTLFFISLILVAGCSSSSDPAASSANETVDSDIDNMATGAQTEANAITDSNPIEASPNDSSSDPTTQVVPAPLVQITTQVDIGITVPVYQSDTLQVRVAWGDTDEAAAWVGDEFWSISLELPTDVENTLAVTFFDGNGEIELASFEQELRTGTNAAEMLNITAEQFNSEQWDSDNDGVSNLDELIAGSNPSVDEDALLEVRDYISLGDLATAGVSGTVRHLSDDRPLSGSLESIWGVPIYGSGYIEIDESGNGTIESSFLFDGEQSRNSSIRTVAGASVTWDIDRWETDGDVSQTVVGTNKVTVLDENISTFFEELTRIWSGTNRQTWVTNSYLTGEKIDGTTYCRPIAGTVSHTYTGVFGFPSSPTITTINKEEDQVYWRVTQSSNDVVSDEYFVRDLKVVKLDTSQPDLSEEHEYFKCEFVDF